MAKKYLAQMNIAVLKEPIDSPLLADFVGDIDRINQIAETSAGFVWRLKDDGSNNALELNPFDNPNFIVNMSVWEDVESLKKFAFHTDHLEVYLKRAKWFERMEKPHLCLWWIDADKIPTAKEGRERLEYLQENGETAFAFSFKKIF